MLKKWLLWGFISIAILLGLLMIAYFIRAIIIMNFFIFILKVIAMA